jgi:hypothetical protein
MIRPASKVITKFLQVMQRHGTCSYRFPHRSFHGREGLREEERVRTNTIRHDNWTKVSQTNDPSLLSCR